MCATEFSPREPRFVFNFVFISVILPITKWKLSSITQLIQPQRKKHKIQFPSIMRSVLGIHGLNWARIEIQSRTKHKIKIARWKFLANSIGHFSSIVITSEWSLHFQHCAWRHSLSNWARILFEFQFSSLYRDHRQQKTYELLCFYRIACVLFSPPKRELMREKKKPHIFRISYCLYSCDR